MRGHTTTHEAPATIVLRRHQQSDANFRSAILASEKHFSLFTFYFSLLTFHFLLSPLPRLLPRRRLIQGRFVLGRKRYRGTPYRLFQLRQGIGPDDSRANGRIRQHPGNCGLGNGSIVDSANGFELVNGRKSRLVHVPLAYPLGPRRLWQRRVAAVFAGEKTRRQRAVGNDANTLIQAKRLKLPLKFSTVHQAVMNTTALFIPVY